MDTRAISNRVVEVRVGVDTAIADIEAPTEAELNAMLVVNDALRWDSFDLNAQASNMESDPTLADAAGAQIRGLLQFGGSASFLQPKIEDASSVLRQAYNLLIDAHTKLVFAIRDMVPIGTPAAAGQVWSAYRVITDAENRQRADTGYSYGVDFLPNGEMGVNAIAPSSPATPVAVTAATGAAAATIGEPKSFKAMYEGIDITVGAKWHSSDVSVLEILPHGWAIPHAAGTAEISATYPGSAVGAPLSITVS